MTVIHGILVPLLLIACITDVRSRRIPNWLTGSAALIGFAYHIGNGGVQGILISIAGLIAGLVLLIPFYIAGGMGAGDVKLMGAVGLLIGPGAVFRAFIFSAITGGIYAVILLSKNGHLKETLFRYGTILKVLCYTGNFVYIHPPEKKGEPLLCYGIAIAIGTFLSVGRDFFIKA